MADAPDDRSPFQAATDPMLLDVATHLLEVEDLAPHTCIVIATGTNAAGKIEARFNGDAHNLDDDEQAGAAMVETLMQALRAVGRSAGVPVAVMELPEQGMGAQG